MAVVAEAVAVVAEAVAVVAEADRVAAAGALAGLGAGWRPELGAVLAERSDLGFVEVIAELVHPEAPLPPALTGLGVPVVPHGTRLSLGGAEPLDPSRVARLAALAERLGSPLVSEHVAFVRAGGVEAGHLLGVPRTRAALRVLARNIADLRAELPVPLALENAASVLAWPDDELDPAAFLTELAERTGALLLVDVANLHGDAVNHGVDPLRFLDALPWEQVAYAHVAGGRVADGIYFDTHLHPVSPEVLGLVAEAAARWSGTPAVLLERDGNYPRAAELHAELDAIHAAALGPGPGRPGPHRRPAAPRRRTAETADADDAGADAADDAVDTAGTAALAGRQAAMVADLVSGAGPADGFDPERFEAVRMTLIDKRRAAVARAWPGLAATSGFPDRFARFARSRPSAGTRADALGFAAAVHDQLAPPARREVLTARLAPRRLAVIVDRVPGGPTMIGLRLPLLAPLVRSPGSAAVDA
ncbi:DUF692 domain-containing protein [Parafrankia discariae]|uniref:DUF692 domain-containing protein n=1 Tax=Parafrankia discariae TaxID=365528 RepID=UPI001E4C9D23|nr:DUF692 domain-containing protein [Parafrankia discariae]